MYIINQQMGAADIAYFGPYENRAYAYSLARAWNNNQRNFHNNIPVYYFAVHNMHGPDELPLMYSEDDFQDEVLQ